MIQKVMICGVDCHPGDGNCNNYCNHNHSKPMADCPPVATPEMVLESARRVVIMKKQEYKAAFDEYRDLAGKYPDIHKMLEGCAATNAAEGLAMALRTKGV